MKKSLKNDIAIILAVSGIAAILYITLGGRIFCNQLLVAYLCLFQQ